MLTNDDISNLVEFFAAKQDLKDLKEDLLEKLATKEQHNELMNKLDWIVGSLQRMEEEQITHQPVHD